MVKILILSTFAATVIMAGNTFINPLPNSVKSIDNGGVKQAIDAYKDGIGAELVDQPGIATDNSAMNILTIKYGEAAKINNVTIIDQVVYGTSPVATQAEKSLLDGTVCNDGNIQTMNDIYNNGICSGIMPVSCNQIKTLLPTAASGSYTISPNGTPFTAYCNMTVNGGGWTLVYQSTSDNVSRSLISASDWNTGPSGDFSRLYSMRNVKNSSGKYEFYVFNNNNTFLQFTQTNSYDQNPVGNSYVKIAGNFTFNPDATSTWNGLALGNFGSASMNLNCTLSTSYSGTSWWNCAQDQLTGQYGTGPWQIGQANTGIYIYQR